MMNIDEHRFKWTSSLRSILWVVGQWVSLVTLESRATARTVYSRATNYDLEQLIPKPWITTQSRWFQSHELWSKVVDYRAMDYKPKSFGLLKIRCLKTCFLVDVWLGFEFCNLAVVALKGLVLLPLVNGFSLKESCVLLKTSGVPISHWGG